MEDKDKKKPHLFYWEDAEDCWCPAAGLDLENIIDISIFSSHGDEIEIRFKRFDMTDKEINDLPET